MRSVYCAVMERIVFDLIGNLNKHDDSNEKGQKAIGLDIKQKNNFEGALCFFLHFFAIVEQPRCETT